MNMLSLVTQGKGQFVVGEVDGQKIPAFKLKDEDAVTALQPIGMTPEKLAATKQKLREIERQKTKG